MELCWSLPVCCQGHSLPLPCSALNHRELRVHISEGLGPPPPHPVSGQVQLEVGWQQGEVKVSQVASPQHFTAPSLAIRTFLL